MPLSFYVIIKKSSAFTIRPYHNWIADMADKYVGIRFIILGLDFEIAKYDRTKHLELILNEYRTKHQSRNSDILPSPGNEPCEKILIPSDLEEGNS